MYLLRMIDFSFKTFARLLHALQSSPHFSHPFLWQFGTGLPRNCQYALRSSVTPSVSLHAELSRNDNIPLLLSIHPHALLRSPIQRGIELVHVIDEQTVRLAVV